KSGLASLLKRFGVKPITVRCGVDTAKGYRLVDLTPSFKLYLPPLPPQNETSQPSQKPVVPPLDAPEVLLCDGCDVSLGDGTEDEYDRLEREGFAEHGGG